jgi:hypothetical protein
MLIIGHRIRVLAMAAVLWVGLSRSGTAQMADTTDTLSIETVNVTVSRVKEPAKAPIAKPETKGRAPSTDATWVPGFWNLQGDRSTGPSAGWVWVPGRWLTPPVRDARWDPAHWGWSDGWWSWIPGHWVQRGPHGYPPSLQTDEISQDDISQ